MSSKDVLSHFWDLASTDEAKRLKAASKLLCTLIEAQKQYDGIRTVQTGDENDKKAKEEGEEEISCCEDLKYSVKRLVKGLASSRKGARPGFATALTEVLSEFNCLTPEQVLGLIKENLSVTGSAKAEEERGCYIGQAFGLISVFRSQIKQDKISSVNSDWLPVLITRVRELSKKKSYLKELCAKVIVDILTVVSPSVFKKLVYPSVKEIIEGGWEQATPETLLIALALQRLWGDRLDKKIVKGAWKCSFIADKMNYPQLGAVLQESISSHPRIHCVWDEIFFTLFNNNPASDFQLFWSTVVEERLFESTLDRKFLGFQLVKKVIPQISANQVSVVFSKNMIRTFISILKSTQSFLYKAAKELTSSLPVLVSQNKDLEVPASLLEQLLGENGIVHFDKLTKTATVENLFGILRGSRPQTFLAWLLEIFDRGSVGASKPESRPMAMTVESTRIIVLNQLFQLIKTKTDLDEGDRVKQSALFFLLEHAYFEADFKVTMSPLLRQTSGQRFVSAMRELSSRKEMKQVELYEVVQHAKKLLDDEKYKVVSDQWTDEAASAFKKAVKLVEKIQKKRRKSGDVRQEDKVFEMLFCHMALHLFVEPEQAIETLTELKACYERQRQKNQDNENTDEEPHWVEVLIEVLLSLLTRPSSLFRHVVDQVFIILAPHLTLNALNMCLETLDLKKGAHGETLEVVDESGEEEEDDDDEEMKDVVEVKERETTNGNLKSGENDSNDVDEDDEEEKSSEDEDDAVGEVDEAFRAEVKAALGPAMFDMDREGSSSEEDLDDEAMMQLDAALAAAFKAQMEARMNKSKKKDAAKIILHFKLRVLDLIEIFIKKQASNPLILELINPLLDLVRSSFGSKDFHTLGEKAEGLFKNKLCSSKELPPVSSIDANAVHDKIDHLVEKSLSAPSIVIVTLITRACLYLVRVLRGSQTTQEPSVTITSEAQRQQDWNKTKVSLLSSERLSVAFKKALKDFMERRSTHLHPVLFTELINRFPHLGWLLAEDLIQYLESGVNNFRKSQACQMLLQLMTKKTAEHSQHLKAIVPSLQTTLISVMTKASGEETDLKVKHVREVLRLTYKLISQAKKSEEVSALLQTDELRKGVALIQQSTLFEKSPDLKSICNQIYSSLSRDDNARKIKPEKSKRKREVSEDLKDESSSERNGVDSAQVDSDGDRKRKKKKKKDR